MKRQILAVVVGSLLAVPAFANDEIDAGNLPQLVTSSKSTDQVRAELIAAQHSGNFVVNAELGTLAKPQTSLASGKTREQVRAEVAAARRSGDYIINAELGTTAKHL